MKVLDTEKLYYSKIRILNNFYLINKKRGLGRDRTGDLTIFSRALVPTELPSLDRKTNNRDPDGT